MCRIEVEPESLAELGSKLERAAAVADDVHQFGSRTAMFLGVAECGSEQLALAIWAFLEGWAHGCGFLHRDAQTLAGLLTRAGTVYLDVEAAIAGVGQ